MAGLLDLFQTPGTDTSAWATPLGLPPVVTAPSLPPWAQFLQEHQNTLSNAFGGMVGASNLHDALGGWTKGIAAGQPQDQQMSLLQQQQAQQAASVKQAQDKQNQTIAWLKQNAPKYAGAVANGAMSPAEAYKAALADAAGPKVDPFTLGPGQVRYDANAQPIAKGPEAVKTENAPNGYRYTADGKLEFIPGGPADPSTAAKTTEATRRNQQLATVMVPEAKTLLGDGSPQSSGTYDALADPKNMIAGSNPVTYGLASPQYQQAKSAIRTIVASYLYSVSGATANPGEVDNQTAVLTPQFGDSPQSIAEKKARLQTMVQAVVQAASGTPITVPSQLPQNAGDSQPPAGVDAQTWQFMTPEERALWQ